MSRHNAARPDRNRASAWGFTVPDTPNEAGDEDAHPWWDAWMRWVEHAVNLIVNRINGLQRQHEEVSSEMEEAFLRIDALEKEVGFVR